jgi:hypothetical protein
MKTACHGRWQREYESKTPFTTIPRKRTLLEAFLHQDPSEQVEDESHLDTLSNSSPKHFWHPHHVSYPHFLIGKEGAMAVA